jgi:pilus assembly protein CpaE
VALAPHAKVALVDLDLELGDVAVTLGMAPKFTALDALSNLSRVDSDFLLSLMLKHDSGLLVLGAPDTIPAKRPSKEGIGALLRAIREDFAYVVVDAGSRSFDAFEGFFDAATTVYLVTQVSVPDLRNANRFVTRYFAGGKADKLEIVLNRYVTRDTEIDELAITKALTLPAKWTVPNDYEAARRAQNTGVTMVLDKTRVAQAVTEMSKAARGEVAAPAKKKLFGLF